MEKQQNFTDIEYSNRRRTTKREAFLEKMNATLPWDKWVSLVVPYYPDGKRGHRSQEIERMICILRRSAATGAVTSGHLAAQRPPVIRWSF